MLASQPRTSSAQQTPKASSTPTSGGLLFYGDPHGSWRPLLEACIEAPPKGVILLGDCDLTLPLRQQIAPVFSAGIPVLWIPGNHDASSAEAYDRLWGDYPAGNLHTRVVEIGGMRVAGLGGVFKGRIWHPDASGPLHNGRSDYLRHLPHTSRWRGGLPLRARDALFPEDMDAVARVRADVLVSHEAPSCHRHGFLVVDRAAQACGARLIIHGADSDDVGQAFQLMPDTDSNPRRTVIPMIPSRIVIDVAMGSGGAFGVKHDRFGSLFSE